MISPLNEAALEVAALLLAAPDAAARATWLPLPLLSCFLTPPAPFTGLRPATAMRRGQPLLRPEIFPSNKCQCPPAAASSPSCSPTNRGAHLSGQRYSARGLLHLHIAFRRIACLSAPALNDRLIGCVEILNFSTVFDPEELDQLARSSSLPAGDPARKRRGAAPEPARFPSSNVAALRS